MRSFDRDGRLLCEMQGTIFEQSAENYDTSSAVFVRRYMNSDYAVRMDHAGNLDRPTDAQEAFESLDSQYGPSSYGSEKYVPDELYWIGYIYRYWAYTREISSKAIYRRFNVRDMHQVYYAYHTLDPENAIQRLTEAKNMPLNDEQQLALAVEILRRIRMNTKGRN